MPSIALSPYEQSILNAVVFTHLCNEEVYSLIKDLDKEARQDAMRLAMEWSLTHGLISDD